MGKSDAGSNVPRTFCEMFQFNLVVMGNGVKGWILNVLDSFDVLVTQVMSAPRLLEEIIVLSIKIASKVDVTTVILGEFKSCMMASLRSLLPRDWTTNHELAWTCLWYNVTRLLNTTLPLPGPLK